VIKIVSNYQKRSINAIVQIHFGSSYKKKLELGITYDIDSVVFRKYQQKITVKIKEQAISLLNG
jgi:hypothetical protein